MTGARASATPPPPVSPEAEVAELRRRLQEAEDTLEAIRSGEVDALVISTAAGEQIYTLQGAETAYRVMVEAMNEGAMTLVEDGTILYCNRHLAEMLGTPLDALLGASLRPYVASADRPVFDALLDRGKAGFSRGEIELHSDAGTLPVQLSISALDVQGARGCCVIATDLSEQKRNADILAAERLARSILEQAADAIVVCGPSGVIIRARASACRLAGGECIGLAFATAFPLVMEDDGGVFDPTASGCTLQSREAALPARDGTGQRHMLVSAAPLHTDDGAVLGCVITMADFTERKAAEEALKRADRRKDEFLATLSHELRNPLAPVRNAVNIMKLRSPDEPELVWAREIIERQVHQLTRLIDDLLDVSRITRDHLELRRERVELSRILEEAVEISGPIIEQEGHHLALALPDEPIHLDGDATRLAQVFSNLLNNAAKYTPSGGSIDLATRREDGHVVISVRDNGVGIPLDMLKQVFDMFLQVDASTSRSRGGLGIGLTLVKRLVDMHGGTVEARSDGLGRGSEFVVRLPVLS